ncbi:hypothetical protein BDZ97DRAFT_1827586 [Flammula alnicola]|nr:hypothetical protein BDZ97DRAFT_1827586 [Flammula alnicola]
MALPLINRSRVLAIKTNKSQWESLASALTQPLHNLQSFSLLREFYQEYEDLALPTTLFFGTCSSASNIPSPRIHMPT